MAFQPINVGAAPDDQTGDKTRAAWQKANANFAELYDVRPILYTFSSDPLLEQYSLIHQPCYVGQVMMSMFATTNRIAGSGGRWECINATAGEANDGALVSDANTNAGNFVLQGKFGQWALREAEPDLSQMMVNTRNGSLQQGRTHAARDACKGPPPYRKRIRATGKYTAAGTIDMQHCPFDFSQYLITEPAGGFAGALLRVGDPASGTAIGSLGLADKSWYAANIVGINEGPNSASGPNGTAGYDFQGSPGQAVNGKVPSAAVGLEIYAIDSLVRQQVDVSRCKTGVHIHGNTEKIRVDVNASYCDVAIREAEVKPDGTSSPSTPDTNRYTLTANQCKQWFICATDSTSYLIINAESRLVDGSEIPAAYDNTRMIPTPAIMYKNGKRQKIEGELRGHNGRLMIYVDRDTAHAGLGSDTITFNGLSTVHTYGTVLLVDRCAHLEGIIYIKDSGNGRLNSADTTSSIPMPAIEINRITNACTFRVHMVDVGNSIGCQIGNSEKNLFSTGIDFAPMHIIMREPVGVGLLIDKAVRCSFPINNINANIQINAAVTDCYLEVSADFVRRGKQIIKDAAATVRVRFRGSLTRAQLLAIAAPFEGMSVDAVSDYGHRPAVYTGGAWVIAPAYGAL